MTSKSPLIAHVIHHLGIGGLENGLVNLINRIPENRYRHLIICMDDYSDFRNRIQRADVDIIAIHKKPGKDPLAKWRLFKLFKQLQPAIIHSRNLSGLDALVPAFLAGIKHRIHGEHGRDIDDLNGDNRKLQLLRRLHKPLIHRYIALSKDLKHYLIDKIGVDSSRISQIYNGVDTDRFKPNRNGAENWSVPDGFFSSNTVLIGTVGRFQYVKDQMNLAEGFIALLNQQPDLKEVARLVLIGDGPLLAPVLDRIRSAGYEQLVWAPGARDDVAEILPELDIFVLPSLAEGISNTLLEAMSCGLPVIATAVGGNPELVKEGVTGSLVPPTNPAAIAEKLALYIRNKPLRTEQGMQARSHIKNLFSLDAMVESYLDVYDSMTERT